MKQITKNDILNTVCSLWPNYDSSKVYHYPLWYILKRVPLYPENLPRLKQLRKLDDADERRAVKKGLPVWMPGRWTDTSKAGLQEFSGFLQFDLDHLADPQAVKRYLATIPSVALVSVSCSGRGLFGLVRIPEDGKDETRYQSYWYAFADHLRAQGLELDPSGKNINRLRFVSLDDDFFAPSRCGLWTQAVEVVPPASFTVSPPSTPPPSFTSTHTIDPNRKQYGYAQRLSFCQSLTDTALARGIDPAPTKSAWYTMGRSLASDFKEDGRNMFVSLSGLWESQHGPQGIDPDKLYDECIDLAGQWEGGSYAFQRLMKDAGITVI